MPFALDSPCSVASFEVLQKRPSPDDGSGPSACTAVGGEQLLLRYYIYLRHQ
jgi:hypothetical protein